jgi:ABC-type polysaccharide/polyol phosphate transport system ATPase subunit
MNSEILASGAVRFDRVSKGFSQQGGQRLLRDRLRDLFSSQGRRIEVLKDVSFELAPGDSLGLIGSNGAGKSTLLNLATGVVQPDSGGIEIGGRVGALLELGAGFHGDLTGAENLRIQAALMGLSRLDVERKFDEIVGFSNIREFIHQPLRTYSHGMILRLAFSVAVSATADVLLIDELIGVGDQVFKEASHRKVLEMRQAGLTLLLASHSEELLTSLCDRAMWLERGRVMMSGPTREILEAYRDAAAKSPALRGKARA